MDEIGDPTMIILPSIEQWTNAYTFSTTTVANTDSSSTYQNYLVLASPSDKLEGLIFDGQVSKK